MDGMIEFVGAAVLLLVSLAAAPCWVMDSGSGAGAGAGANSADGANGAGAANASEGVGGGNEDSGAAAGADTDGSDGVRARISEALEEVRSDGNAGSGPSRPAEDGRAVRRGGEAETAAGPADRIFGALQLDPASIPRDPAAVPEFVRSTIERWYQQQYAAVAERARDTMLEQAQWYEQARGVMNSPAYTIAEQLAGDPRLMSAVNEYLQGLHGAPAAGDEGELDEGELDETTRRLYRLARSGAERASTVEQRIEALQAEREAEARAQAEAEMQRAAQLGDQRAREQEQVATAEVQRRLGFDPTDYPKQWAAARAYAARAIKAYLHDRALYQERRSAGQGVYPPAAPNVTQLLIEGCGAAGLEQVRARRAASSRAAAGPPPDSAEAGSTDNVRDVIRRNLAEATAR